MLLVLLDLSNSVRVAFRSSRVRPIRSENDGKVEPTTGVEPVTPSLPRKCSTTEPRGLEARRAPDSDSTNGDTLFMERETGFGPATLSLEG